MAPSFISFQGNHSQFPLSLFTKLNFQFPSHAYCPFSSLNECILNYGLIDHYLRHSLNNVEYNGSFASILGNCNSTNATYSCMVVFLNEPYSYPTCNSLSRYPETFLHPHLDIFSM